MLVLLTTIIPMQQDIVCAVWLGRRAVLIKMEKVSPLWWPCPPYRIYRVFMACKCPVAMCMHTHCPFACAMPSGQCWKVCSLGASMSHLIVQLSTLAPRIQQLSPEHTNRCLWVVTVCVCVCIQWPSKGIRTLEWHLTCLNVISLSGICKQMLLEIFSELTF